MKEHASTQNRLEAKASYYLYCWMLRNLLFLRNHKRVKLPQTMRLDRWNLHNSDGEKLQEGGTEWKFLMAPHNSTLCHLLHRLSYSSRINCTSTCTGAWGLVTYTKHPHKASSWDSYQVLKTRCEKDTKEPQTGLVKIKSPKRKKVV